MCEKNKISFLNFDYYHRVQASSLLSIVNCIAISTKRIDLKILVDESPLLI